MPDGFSFEVLEVMSGEASQLNAAREGATAQYVNAVPSLMHSVDNECLKWINSWTDIVYLQQLSAVRLRLPDCSALSGICSINTLLYRH